MVVFSLYSMWHELKCVKQASAAPRLPAKYEWGEGKCKLIQCDILSRCKQHLQTTSSQQVDHGFMKVLTERNGRRKTKSIWWS